VYYTRFGSSYLYCSFGFQFSSALRRSSSQHTPTRTIRLTEQEHQQAAREQTPPTHRVTLESLQQRPRSNQRNRTPLRNESPLDPDEFRRETSRGRSNVSEGGRITIRPGAGTAVGTVAPMRIREESPERSAKQGPSHRKVRRWNNDHFDKLAAEIAPSSKAAAVALLKGKQDAYLYRDVINPAEDNKSESMTRFMQDGTLHDVRNQFFEGELPSRPDEVPGLPKERPLPQTGQEMLYRIDGRLRRVVTKACRNSMPASRVIKTFETFVVDSFRKKPRETLPGDWWNQDELLLERPTVTARKDGKFTAQFYFDPQNSTGGFHRLLLHAVCQFHGLLALSRVVQIKIGAHQQSRALMVTGPAVDTKFRLLDVLSQDDEDAEVEALGARLEDSWTVV